MNEERAKGALARLMKYRVLSFAEGGALLVLIDMASRPDPRHELVAGAVGFRPDRVGSVFVPIDPSTGRHSRRRLAVAMGICDEESQNSSTLKARIKRWAELDLIEDHGGVIIIRVGGLIRLDRHRGTHETDESIADGRPWRAVGGVVEVRRWSAQIDPDRVQTEFGFGRSTVDHPRSTVDHLTIYKGSCVRSPLPPEGGVLSPWDSGLPPTWAEAFAVASIPPRQGVPRPIRLDDIARYQLARLCAVHGEAAVCQAILDHGGTTDRPLTALRKVFRAPRPAQAASAPAAPPRPMRQPRRPTAREAELARLAVESRVGRQTGETPPPAPEQPPPPADPQATATLAQRVPRLADRAWLAAFAAVALDGETIVLDSGQAAHNEFEHVNRAGELAALGARVVVDEAVLAEWRAAATARALADAAERAPRRPPVTVSFERARDGAARLGALVSQEAA